MNPSDISNIPTTPVVQNTLVPEVKKTNETKKLFIPLLATIAIVGLGISGIYIWYSQSDMGNKVQNQDSTKTNTRDNSVTTTTEKNPVSIRSVIESTCQPGYTQLKNITGYSLCHPESMAVLIEQQSGTVQNAENVIFRLPDARGDNNAIRVSSSRIASFNSANSTNFSTSKEIAEFYFNKLTKDSTNPAKVVKGVTATNIAGSAGYTFTLDTKIVKTANIESFETTSRTIKFIAFTDKSRLFTLVIPQLNGYMGIEDSFRVEGTVPLAFKCSDGQFAKLSFSVPQGWFCEMVESTPGVYTINVTNNVGNRLKMKVSNEPRGQYCTEDRNNAQYTSDCIVKPLYTNEMADLRFYLNNQGGEIFSTIKNPANSNSYGYMIFTFDGLNPTNYTSLTEAENDTIRRITDSFTFN